MKRKVAVFAFTLILLVSAVSVGAESGRVIVLGFDGMDAKLASNWMNEGKLPNLAKLRDEGTYSSLLSTQPPESPGCMELLLNGHEPQESMGFLTSSRMTLTHTSLA